MQGPSIVVGIDFGTTFSGVAWAVEGSVDDVEVLSSWPGGGNRTSVKVPSTISYEGDKIQWGYQIGPLAEACRGIKLLLDEDQHAAYTPSIESRSLLTQYGVNPVDAAADYIKQLIREVKQVLGRRFAISAEAQSLQFILTVPAVWSDKAKDATLRAALAAGITARDISLVSEPEAAALYALRAIQPNSIAKGDVFTVCDAGGGTVDLISYQIKTLEPLCLVEVTKGTGSVCGSMLLDYRFEDLLRDRMGYDRYQLFPQRSKEAAITYWQERVKPNYTGIFDDDFADVDYFIPVPGTTDDPDIPIEDGFFFLTNEDVEAIFEPSVEEVENLVAQQMVDIGKAGFSAKAIILVGGFGSSEYLFNRLRMAHPKVTVMQPPNAWSAVVSGAVHRGLEGNKIESRIARRHYGTRYCTRYDPNRTYDSGCDKSWNELEEEYQMDNLVHWYIKKSSSISQHNPIRMSFYRAVRADNEASLIFHQRLIFCNDDDAPATITKRVMTLCDMEADLRQIPRQLFTKQTNSKGIEYYKIPFTLVMTPTSASLLLELEFNGVSYGSVRTKY
ncbi:hypothetical protein BJX99DRAFT_242456 [Aspergillus californicus]